MATDETLSQQITNGRPCSICGKYEVGSETAWLCYHCGFNGPLPQDQEAVQEAAK